MGTNQKRFVRFVLIRGKCLFLRTYSLLEVAVEYSDGSGILLRTARPCVHGCAYTLGRVAERFKATVLKTVVGFIPTVSSNLTPSAYAIRTEVKLVCQLSFVWEGAGVDDWSCLLSSCSGN